MYGHLSVAEMFPFLFLLIVLSSVQSVYAVSRIASWPVLKSTAVACERWRQCRRGTQQFGNQFSLTSRYRQRSSNILRVGRARPAPQPNASTRVPLHQWPRIARNCLRTNRQPRNDMHMQSADVAGSLRRIAALARQRETTILVNSNSCGSP